MAFRVDVTEQAFQDIDAIFAYIADSSPQNAVRWRDQVLEKMQSLFYHPLRHGLAPEAQSVGVEVHQKMFGVYRILYTVTDDWVTIHGVRHGSRRPIHSEELPKPKKA